MNRFVSATLLALAEAEFPRLMRHRTNREDALQTLALVQLASQVDDAIVVARQCLAWLEYELGVVPAPPSCARPEFSPASAHETTRIYRQDLTATEREVIFNPAAA